MKNKSIRSLKIFKNAQKLHPLIDESQFCISVDELLFTCSNRFNLNEYNFLNFVHLFISNCIIKPIYKNYNNCLRKKSK